MRTLLIAMVGLVIGGAGISGAAVTCVENPLDYNHRFCLINNGLAPPSPDNVIQSWDYLDDSVFVRNVGCPPGWPASGNAGDDCPSPGAPTEVEVIQVPWPETHVGLLLVYESSGVAVRGGSFASAYAYDSSTVTISGGSGGIVYALDSSTVTMSGGEAALFAYHSSTVTLTGGSVNTYLRAAGSSTITVVGRNFEVDGAPVPYGDLTAQTGWLSGTLQSGDPINRLFYQGGRTESPCSVENPCSGTITLLPPSLNTPTLSPWSQLVLVVSLLGAGLGVWRRRGPPAPAR